jgi:hypothetical protein
MTSSTLIQKFVELLSDWDFLGLELLPGNRFGFVAVPIVKHRFSLLVHLLPKKDSVRNT